MKIAREAWPFVLPVALPGALGVLLGMPILGGSLILLAILLSLFFRIPHRPKIEDHSLVLAPASGLITRVDRVQLDDIASEQSHRVVTFLSVFDIHVQRSPVSGTVISSTHTAGRKVAAFREDAAEVNENQLTVVEDSSGCRFATRQIAGLLARRVVSYLKPGDRIGQGDLMGLIKFGSRVDQYIPASWTIMVSQGQRVKEGVTPIARRGTTS